MSTESWTSSETSTAEIHKRQSFILVKMDLGFLLKRVPQHPARVQLYNMQQKQVMAQQRLLLTT